MKLRITDNAHYNGFEGCPLAQCVESTDNYDHEHRQLKHDLNILGGKPLSAIVSENHDLLVFPHSFEDQKDNIADHRICSYHEPSDRLYTGNLMGFVGVNNTQLSIRSRFASQADDHFLHYMLMKVFCPNIFRLEHDTCSESVFDFLLYMFPRFFNEAMKQGLFKEYQRFQRNDVRVKGSIDVSRHISTNIPFNGRIAYNTREYSHDNRITQLIRHTIEHIKRSAHGAIILHNRDTIANVRILTEATPSYSHMNLRSVLNNTRRPLAHPYFTKYRSLQKLCRSILNQQKLKYGSEKDSVYGILFDGAWLWEEYLNTIFKDWGLLHAENRTGKNPIYLFEGNSYVRYPDFYATNHTVVDAKYKRLTTKEIGRDDIHQIITYMHVLNAKSAFLAHPRDYGSSSIDIIGALNGLGGTIGRIGLRIPQVATSLLEFQQLIEAETATLTQQWHNHWKKPDYDH